LNSRFRLLLPISEKETSGEPFGSGGIVHPTEDSLMLGFGAIGESAIGALPDRLMVGARNATLSVSSVIIPEKASAEGVLIKSTSVVWDEIVRALGDDWSIAFGLPPEKWEEIVAGAFKRAQYDEVTLTPLSGDHGRDVIAVKHGVGCVKIIGSVKRYAAGNLVPYDDIRALLGVMSGERNVSKGIITTTSDFPPKVAEDPFIGPFLPTRLELMNGETLRDWLVKLREEGGSN
jgi:restriction system protein